MKKLLFTLIALLIASPVWAASYYGCASAAINADSTFCTTPTGSCAGSTPVTAATALAGTHTLFANGCTITIPDGATLTATKLSNKDDGGDMVDGGQFTVTTTGWSTGTTLTADIESGGTTGAALAISGNGNLDPVFTLVGNTTGGSASTIYGIQVGHTVGRVQVTGNVTAGSNASANGIYHNTAGPLTITGNCTGATANGYNGTSTGVTIINGTCTGSGTATAALGCYCGSTSADCTFTGNLVASKAQGAAGNFKWVPSAATKYISVKTTAGADLYVSAGLGSDVGGTQITGANTAAQISTGTYFVKKDDGVFTQGSASTSTGGGAWAF